MTSKYSFSCDGKNYPFEFKQHCEHSVMFTAGPHKFGLIFGPGRARRWTAVAIDESVQIKIVEGFASRLDAAEHLINCYKHSKEKSCTGTSVFTVTKA